MYIKIYVDESFCEIAVQHSLNYDIKITSKKKFITAVHTYLWQYGTLCIDDHLNEYSEHEEQAKEIVNKYYK